jgi:nucleotide-binding universal stress UspA family protein
MYTVLFAVDPDMDDPESLVSAVDDLPVNNVEAVVLNVFKEFRAAGEGKVRSEDLFDETDIPETVEALVSALRDRDIDASVQRKHGDPAECILELAADIDASAIVLGGRKRSPVGKVLFGSVTQSILLTADRPVTVIPQAQ